MTTQILILHAELLIGHLKDLFASLLWIPKKIIHFPYRFYKKKLIFLDSFPNFIYIDGDI